MPQRGSENSFPTEQSQTDTSTPGASETCNQAISPATPNVISSLGLEVGPTPCGSPDGLRTDLFGPEAVLANPSAAQASSAEPPMSGTSGRSSSGLSASASLQSSLESRLQAQLRSTGSTLYRLTWKERVTPLGRRICALRASVLRISDRDSTGWPTPCTQDGPNGGPAQGIDRLPGAAAMAAWATPSSRDWKDTGADLPPRPDGTERFDQLPRQANLAGWGTPTAQDAKHATLSPSERMRAPENLRVQVYTAMPTRRTASGEMLTGSSAAMESGGQLNPAHSRWLMGFPPEWDACAVTAMPSSRKSRRNLLKQQFKIEP